MLRRLTQGDIFETIELARDLHSEASNYAGIPFSQGRTKLTLLRCLVPESNSVCWVYEKDGKIIASLAAQICAFDTADLFYVADKWLYVKPEYRHTRESFTFLNEAFPALLEWAAEQEKVISVFIGISSGIKPELSEKLLKKFGAKEHARIMRLA